MIGAKIVDRLQHSDSRALTLHHREAREPHRALFALGSVRVPAGSMTIELDPSRCRTLDAASHARLAIREFFIDHVLAELDHSWPYELRGIPARLEHLDAAGFVSEVPCTIDYEGIASARPGCVRLRLRDEGLEQRGWLCELYRQLRFPMLLSRDACTSEELLELFALHGDFAHTHASSPAEAWTTAKHDDELTSGVVYLADDGMLLGHLAMTRAYSRTWLAHQLAFVGDHPQSFSCQTALYDYLATFPTLQCGHGSHFLMSFYDRNSSWNRLVFEYFVGTHASPKEAVRLDFDLFKPIPRDVSFEPANAHDHPISGTNPRESHDDLVALLAEQLPPLARVAFDLVTDDLEHIYLSTDTTSQDFPRRRRVFPVHDGCALVGLALCETGSGERSLADEFTAAYLFFRQNASRSARRDLVARVHRHYLELGHPRPTLIIPTGTFDDELEFGLDLGLEHTRAVGCVVLAADALASFRRYVGDCLRRVRPPVRRSGPPHAP